ncbi:PREDICTED: odorant receptor 45a-like isoform X2 [Vollenhovia emeryi]|uniref:odorant receptor 45a-like isoform X2 n=1 Tax=Vollenhovia emeryi TaxID=411798 RepID=UPI0005F524E7|nr:PREDICTED: odorant receptor 45a-like isoform X2 [Vollenhovia emeryi]
MEFLGYHYYKLYRICLLSLGLWPYGDSYFKQIYAIFCIFTILFSIIAQLLKIFTMEYNLELVLTDLSFAIPFIAFLLKYSTFYILSQKIKELMEHIQIDWNGLQNEGEVEIIRKYAKTARNYMYAVVGLTYPSILLLIYISMPDIFDVAALNKSHIPNLPFFVEYFLDEQKYYYPILLHTIATITIGVVTILATETLFFAYIYHVCGMFEIVSILLTLNKENTIRVKLIDAIEIHQRTFEFFEYLTSTFALSYFFLSVLGVASLSINLFCLSQVAILTNKKKDVAPFAVFVIGHFYYLFIWNYMGHKVIDSSTEIFKKAYETQWYTAPVQMQKLLLFIMQRSMKSCKLVMGNVYYVSLEQFTSVTCDMDMTRNLTSYFSQNNKLIFSACKHVVILLHSTLFCAAMKFVKRMET